MCYVWRLLRHIMSNNIRRKFKEIFIEKDANLKFDKWKMCVVWNYKTSTTIVENENIVFSERKPICTSFCVWKKINIAKTPEYLEKTCPFRIRHTHVSHFYLGKQNITSRIKQTALNVFMDSEQILFDLHRITSRTYYSIVFLFQYFQYFARVDRVMFCLRLDTSIILLPM